MQPFDLRYLVVAHLLWTAVLTGLCLILRARYPYPETMPWFRLELTLLTFTALSPLPLLWKQLSLLWVPPLTFMLATAGFLVYVFFIVRAHLDDIHGRR